ncbi:hypothetical protein UlMin_038154 [Ulmus minor]
MANTPKTKKRRMVTNKPKPKEQEESSSSPSEEDPEPEQELEQSHEDINSDSDSETLPKLLEPYSKDQLIDLICEAAVKDSTLFDLVRDAADRDVSHRKIFVHGLNYATTREDLIEVFEKFGEVDDCKLVVDKNTGKTKGYGFVQFKSRRAAIKALKEPKKKISNRVASCQLASVGPVPAPVNQNQESMPARKIYVTNVPADTDGEKLRDFFSTFGEIEMGPLGFDSETGKSRGFALFVFRTQEGFKKALLEPSKMFEGSQLYCQKATDKKRKNPGQGGPQPQLQPQGQQQLQQPMLAAAMAAAQNLALFQHPGLNPMYNGLLANPMAGMVPMVAMPMNHGVIPTGQVGTGVGGHFGGMAGLVGYNGGLSVGASSQTVQPHHVYPNANSQVGQLASGRFQGAGGSVTGYTSNMWYDILQLDLLYCGFMFICLSFNLLLIGFWFW